MKFPYSAHEKHPGEWRVWAWGFGAMGKGKTKEEAIENLAQVFRKALTDSKTTIGEMEI